MIEPIGTRRGSRKADMTRNAAIGGGGAFDPVSLITGNGGFWRADRGVTSAGGFITQWNDQSSFGHNLTNSGSVPFSATGFNTSFPGLDFADGGSVRMNFTYGSNSFVSTTVSCFLLVFVQGTGANNRLGCLLDNDAGQDYQSRSFILQYTSASGWGPFASNNNTSGVVGANQGNGGSLDLIATNHPYLLGVVFDGAHCNSWVNGAVVGAGTTFTANIGSGPTFGQAILQIGATQSSTSAAYQLAAFGLTQKVMNTTDWTNLKNWCNANWGTSF